MALVGVLLSGIGALLGAVVSGLLPVRGDWWVQGLGAAAPMVGLVALWGVGAAVSLLVLGQTQKAGRALIEFGQMTAGGGVSAFVLGSGVSFIPGVNGGAGILALASYVAVMGVSCLVGGFHDGNRASIRLGFSILGGFAAAGLVLVADIVVKAAT